MSFPTLPSLYSFATPPPECQHCYAPNKTPEPLFLQLTGISPGDDWTPSDPPPPNGTFELTLFDTCSWAFVDGDLRHDYFTAAGTTIFTTNIVGVELVFRGVVLSPGCVMQLRNLFGFPGTRKYFGGEAILTNPLDSGAQNNIELMALLNIEPEIRTFCAPLPIATDIFTHRYTQRNGKTNIYIKYDFT